MLDTLFSALDLLLQSDKKKKGSHPFRDLHAPKGGRERTRTNKHRGDKYKTWCWRCFLSRYEISPSNCYKCSEISFQDVSPFVKLPTQGCVPWIRGILCDSILNRLERGPPGRGCESLHGPCRGINTTEPYPQSWDKREV